MSTVLADSHLLISYDPTAICPSIIDRIKILGRPSLVTTYQELWSAATEPHYPYGFVVPPHLIERNQEDVRQLYEVGLLDSPRTVDGDWIIYRDPGYNGRLRQIRLWNVRVAD